METFTNGRAAALSACTPNEMAMPVTIGTHWLLLKKSDGSDTVTLVEPDAAPNARPPAVGRITVCTTSLMWSTTGILSATTSMTRSTTRMPRTQSFSSHCQPEGSEIRPVNRPSRPSMSRGM